jgi:hypothetical protein
MWGDRLKRFANDSNNRSGIVSLFGWLAIFRRRVLAVEKQMVLPSQRDLVVACLVEWK